MHDNISMPLRHEIETNMIGSHSMCFVLMCYFTSSVGSSLLLRNAFKIQNQYSFKGHLSLGKDSIIFCFFLTSVAPFVRWISDDNWLNELLFWQVRPQMNDSNEMFLKWSAEKNMHFIEEIAVERSYQKPAYHKSNTYRMISYKSFCALQMMDIGYIGIWSLNEQLYALLNSPFNAISHRILSYSLFR